MLLDEFYSRKHLSHFSDLYSLKKKYKGLSEDLLLWN
jgi:hypothetical protein